MKFPSSLAILLAIFVMCLYSCRKEGNPILVPPTDTNGTLLLWTGDSSDFGACGPTLFVTLSNGRESTITNYWATPPTTCTGQFGGLFSLAPGNYSYTITTIGPCDPFTGFARVDTGRCTRINFHP